jgi:16S rRNA (guanine527-N7)-methyltransferase
VVTGDSPLLEVLERARTLGFLGPGPLSVHLEHAQGFRVAAQTWEMAPPGRMADLGSGGGVPGLPLALQWPDTRVVLVESMERRVEFLRWAVEHCGLDERVQVFGSRAETLAENPADRGGFDLVTARSFGPPATAAEIAAPLLRPGGALIVSEPPETAQGADRRWPPEGLEVLGMGPGWEVNEPFRYRVVPQLTPAADRFPRRVGVATKRPLF